MTVFGAAAEQASREGLTLHSNTTCVICDAPVPEDHIGLVRDHEYPETTEVQFPVVRCPDCRLVYLQPRPDVTELSRIYPARYFAYHQKTSGQNPTGLTKIVINNQIREMRGRVEPLVQQPTDRPLRILDVGAGYGRSLTLLSGVYPDAETHGVDMDAQAVAGLEASGHVAYHGRFEDLDLPSDYFDLVISVHVIEHVPRPDQFLEKCRDLAVPGGVVLIETPDTGALSFKMFSGRHWGTYHAPRHFYMFDRTSLDRLAQRLGLEIIGRGNYCIAVFPWWTLHSICMGLLGRRIADWLFHPVEFGSGKLRYLVALIGLGMLQRVSLKLTRRSSAMWVAFRRS